MLDDSFVKASTAYWFAADYHNGQTSKLYELLCKNPYKPGPLSCGPEKDSVEEMHYSMLESMPLNQTEETIEQWLNERKD